MYRGFASMADLDYAVDPMKACLATLKPSQEEALRRSPLKMTRITSPYKTI
jgi:hypothetical protein